MESREYTFIKSLINPNGTNLKYFAIDLLTGKYNLNLLIEEAKKNKELFNSAVILQK